MKEREEMSLRRNFPDAVPEYTSIWPGTFTEKDFIRSTSSRPFIAILIWAANP
jgi:hypothetical protein